MNYFENRKAIINCQTLLTIGYGDSVVPVLAREMVFVMPFILLSVFLSSLIVANMTSLISTMNVVHSKFKLEMRSRENFMTENKLRDDVQKNVRAYFKHLYSKQYGVSDFVMRTYFPTIFDSDIRKILAKVPNVFVLYKIPTGFRLLDECLIFRLKAKN